MHNLSLKGLEGENSVRSHNLVKNSYFDPRKKSWLVNNGEPPSAMMTVLNEDVICTISSFPYQLTLPLLISGGRPPYTWSIEPHVVEAGKIDLENKTIIGNTVFGSFSATATAQVFVQATDSNDLSITKLLNITSEPPI